MGRCSAEKSCRAHSRMPRVIFSVRARTDLSRLHRFLALKDEDAAKRAVPSIRDVFFPLKHSPMIGRPVEDHPEFRELVIDFGASGYLVLYRFESSQDVVTILAIKHQREDDYK
jgi:plasmid stabilization system protein ParE